MPETNDLFGGLDSFLKNKNTENGVTDQRELETVQTENKEVETQETKATEKADEFKGLTLEELEAEFKNSTKVEVESDKEDTTDADKTKEVESQEQEEEPANEGGEDIWKDLSALFKEKGIVEEDFDSQEKMVEVFGKEVEKGVNDWIDNLPEEVKSIVSAAAEGLNGQSLKSFIESRDNELQLSSIEDSQLESDLDLAKTIVRNHLKTTTKFNDTKIEKLITQMEDLDELVGEAKDAKASLVEIEKERQAEEIKQAKARQAEDAARQVELIKEVKKVVDETKEIIPGIKLTEKEQKELHKMITTPVELRGNTPISAAMKLREANPIEFEKKLNYFIMKGFFDGKFDDISKKAETKVVSKIEKQIEDSAKKLLNKSISKTREEEDPNKKNSLIDAWKNRKK